MDPVCKIIPGLAIHLETISNIKAFHIASFLHLSKRMRWAEHVARMGEESGAYRVLVGRPEGKRPLVRPRRRREDNIKMDLREIGIDRANWIRLAQDRV
jgi:hypothetical protein